MVRTIVRLIGSVMALHFAMMGMPTAWAACGSAGCWQQVPAPAGSDLNRLSGFSANDIWAAGTGQSSNTPLMLHHDGSQWTSLSMNNVPSGVFRGVGAWTGYALAVGSAGVASCQGSQCTGVSGPTTPGAYLDNASALSETVFWAVGRHGSPEVALVSRRTNGVWSDESPDVTLSGCPGAGTSIQSGLFDVVTISSDDVWAVGSYTTSAMITLPLVAHRTIGWSFECVPLPSGATGGSLFRLAMVPATGGYEVWAVGRAGATNDEPNWKPYAARRNTNGTWSVVTTGNLPPGVFEGVAGFAPDDVWIAGDVRSGIGSASFAIMLHCDSVNHCAVENIPGVTDRESHLLDLLAIPPATLHGVGNLVEKSGETKALIVKYIRTCPGTTTCGSCHADQLSCDTSDTGLTECIQNEVIIPCPLGQTIHVRNCPCVTPPGFPVPVCPAENQSWFCAP